MSGLGESGKRALVPLRRHEDSLRLVATGEHNALPEQPHLVDDLGEVGAGFGHSHVHFVGCSHATTVHARSISKSVALYNSEVSESPAQRQVAWHAEPPKICTHYDVYDLDCDEFERLYARAEGCCEVCRTPEADTPRGKLVIEHYHHGDLWFVRGLVCDKCNRVMACHDRSLTWGPKTRPRAALAAEFHRRAWGATPEQLAQAERDIAARQPWTPRLGGYKPELDDLDPP